MKRTMISLLAAAALLVPLAGRPGSASAACDDWPVALDIVSLGTACLTSPASFGTTGLQCPIGQVDVTASDSAHHNYDYDLICTSASGTLTSHVTASYDLNNKQGAEKLTGAAGSIEATWTCASDPWGNSSQTVNCVSIDVQANPDSGQFDLSGATYPFSAQYLSTKDYQVLSAQLQNATTQLQAPAPSGPVPTAASHATTSATCAACGVHVDTETDAHTTGATCQICGQTQTSLSILPDLAVTGITGNQNPSQHSLAVYDIAVSNLGAKPQAPVQVEIQVTGSLIYVQMLRTPAGFSCSGQGAVVCTGPVGASGATADFQVQVLVSRAGAGAVSATVNPNGTIQETSDANNAQTLAVTAR